MRRFLACLVAATAFLSLLPAAAMAKGGQGNALAAEHALQRVKDLKRGIGVRTGRELTPALAELAARKNDLDAAGRQEASTFLARPTDSNDSDYYGNTFIGSVQDYCPSGSIYCFHWVNNAASADAPDLTDSGGVVGVPDYIEQMAAVFDAVHACENGTAVAACADGLGAGMGWQEPIPDGTTGGGSNKFDVYIKDLFVQGFYGYAATECTTSGPSCPSYMVMDKDYDRFATATETGLDAMKVTAAHEYNHVLQFGYDVNEDTWMFESTATWAEDKVYPSINDYLQYLPDWVNNTAQPITVGSTQNNLKIYGSAVWNHWLDHGFGGDNVIQDAWSQSATLPAGFTDSFAPDAYKKSVIDHGGSGFIDQFEDFSVASTEWRAPGNEFPDIYPDVPRVASLTVNGSGVQRTLDHTTFQLLSIAPPGGAQTYTLSATVDTGISAAIALVGRTGTSTTGGTVVRQITRLPNGGSGSVSLPDANLYGRITAVLINADIDQNGFVAGDWKFTGDNAKFASVKVASLPTVTTSAASSITATGATLNGTVNPNGQATTYQFEYGTDTSYGQTTTLTAAGSGTTAVTVSAPISGLTAGTTYHFRLVATNGSGSNQGSDQSFTTPGKPIVTTAAASAVTLDGATLNGTVNPTGLPTTYQFEYGTDTSYGQTTTLTGAGSGATPVTGSALISGLTAGTTYHYRLVASNSSGRTDGNDVTFTTAAAATGGTTTSTTTTPATSTTTVATGTQTVAKPRALGLTLTLIPAKLRSVLAKGLRVKGNCGEACTVTIRLVISAKDAKKLKLRTTLASAKGQGGRTLRLRVSKKVAKVLARLKSVRAKLVVSAVAPDGRKAGLSKPVTLRR